MTLSHRAWPGAAGDEAVRAARRRLGGQLAAWRHKAGLTQDQLARRTGHDRSAIAHAEAGDRASRGLIETADRELGAAGRLTAAHDAITAATAATRAAAASRLRTAAAAAASAAPPSPAAAVGTIECTCPACDQRVAVQVTVALLPAVPAAAAR
jgi:transcriptional regulator with XRE-family HTH domain